MSNAIATRSQFMGAAHETVQAAMLGAGFMVARKGKVKTVNRGMVRTMLSGNVAERQQGAGRILLELWCSGKVADVVQAALEVFPALRKASEARDKRIAEERAEDPTYNKKEINLANPSKADFGALMALCGKLAGASTGEKARFIEAVETIKTYEKAVSVEADRLWLAKKPRLAKPA